MFNSLTGVVSALGNDYLYLQTPSIEWNLHIAATTAGLFQPDQKVTLYTFLHHKEDDMTLYGFHSTKQRELFLQLLKVNGIGPKQAIKMLSLSGEDSLIEAIESGNPALLSTVPGIGEKTAAKIILALKGRFCLPQENSEVSGIAKEFIEALTAMGFAKKDCERVVVKLLSEMDASLSSKEREQLIFKKAILQLSSTGA